MRRIPPLVVMVPFLTLAWLADGRAARPELAPDPLRPEEMRLDRAWRARWITAPGESLTDYGVYLFRREFSLAEAPARFVVSVSADNRYRLFVNGTSVCFGPQAGEPMRWRFDTVDLAPWLRAGRNALAVQVWNYGEYRPLAQMSIGTGLILQGDGGLARIVDTGGEGWHVHVDRAWTPLPLDRAALRTFIVVSPGDDIDGSKHLWGWRDVGFDDQGWTTPRVLDAGLPLGVGTDIERWLVPRELPFAEEKVQRLASVRRSEGATPPEGFVEGRSAWNLPPHTTATVLLDQGFETNAFPRLTVSGGRGATIECAYAEALIDAQRRKGNRDDIEGRSLVGTRDRFRPDGGERRVFATLDYRTWRFVELRVTTADQSLTIDDFAADATGYPFRLQARFVSDDPSLEKIWEVGWRTARLCAVDTYMDCPYYERLQYVGDTRIQALISLYLSGDDRLMRNAIALYDRSRLPEGLTQSRYPSASPQVISPFSLFWIGMVHDYWMHCEDLEFVAAQQRGVDSVLAWFGDRVDVGTGLLGPLPYWSFVDWPDAWPWNDDARSGGEAPGARTGGSSILSLQYAIALEQGAALARAFGREQEAAIRTAQAQAIRRSVLARCWDSQRLLVADTPEKKSFSQHAQALAILAGAFDGPAARALIERTLADTSLVPCTVYFRFYLLRAMKRAGLGDRYLDELGPWRDMVARGLTTFAERPEPTRSDCHAWSASPVYEFLATVCGVEPASPGFKSVRIEPHLGRLQRIEGVVAPPQGQIRVAVQRDGESVRGEIDLPATVSGEFVWQGRRQPLHPGHTVLAP
ncbi:alpha-L-rhamnosidase [Opitutaceae bacterium EW11]|nr:alpha-L-rhamnosidase [Opitutaceae bacterium EW11]